MSVIAVMVNCALIGMSDLADRLFPHYTTAERIVFIVILEVNKLFNRGEKKAALITHLFELDQKLITCMF